MCVWVCACIGACMLCKVLLCVYLQSIINPLLVVLNKGIQRGYLVVIVNSRALYSFTCGPWLTKSKVIYRESHFIGLPYNQFSTQPVAIATNSFNYHCCRCRIDDSLPFLSTGCSIMHSPFLWCFVIIWTLQRSAFVACTVLMPIFTI